MEKLKNWLQWLDTNILKVGLIIFIFGIPLYPKIPLITMDYTYISVRFDDFYVGLLFLIYIAQLIRKKVSLDREFLPLFVLFWVAVGLSFLSGIFLTHTLPYHQVAFLNAMRRPQYMVVFFIALSSIQSKKDFLTYLRYIMIAMILVVLYGLGQKFFDFPAIQTMNPEFALGRVLHITAEARISSTFAGHYDLAAYLVFLLPLMLGMYLWKKKTMYLLLFGLALFALSLTASRSSTVAFLFSVIPFLILVRKWKLLIAVVILTGVLSYFSSNLITRFMKTFQVKQIYVNSQTGKVVVPEKISSKELPAGSFYVALKNQEGAPTASTTALLNARILHDVRDEAKKRGQVLTASQEANMVATAQAGLKPVNTVVSDISLATRLQVEWPRAINALKQNPLLGTGAGSITESTDNDYLRWLGEFGLLGTGLFLFIFYRLARKIYEAVPRVSPSEKTLYIAFLFGWLGLMINASYIDVFEASKVAYQFWLMVGFFIGSVNKRVL